MNTQEQVQQAEAAKRRIRRREDARAFMLAMAGSSNFHSDMMSALGQSIDTDDTPIEELASIAYALADALEDGNT